MSEINKLTTNVKYKISNEWIFPIKNIGSSKGILIPSHISKRLSLKNNEEILIRIERENLYIYIGNSWGKKYTGYKKRLYYSGRVSIYIILDKVIVNLLGLQDENLLSTSIIFTIVDELARICKISVYKPDKKFNGGPSA